MSLTHIKKLQSERGFTLVELLIVIVVIGILAAIVIVAYNGVQNRGKTAAAQAAANTIVKKSEAANAIKGSYPQVFSDYSAQVDSSLTGSGISTVTTLSAAPTAPATVLITPCTGTAGTGGVVSYWDYTANQAQTKSYGQPTATGTCAAATAIAAGGPY